MKISIHTYKALMELLDIAKKTADHHEAEKHRLMNPEYIEVKLLEACEAVDRALLEERLSSAIRNHQG